MGLRLYVAATKNDWVNLFHNDWVNLFHNDWVNLFHHVKGGDTITFYADSTFNPQELAAYSIEAIPNLGVATSGQMVQLPFFYAITQQQALILRTVNRNDGSTIYLADSSMNPDSFRIFPGGIYESDFFIVGEISSVSSEGDYTIPIAKRLIGRIRRSFHRGNFCWIGPECYDLYNSTRIFTDDSRHTSERMPGINTMF